MRELQIYLVESNYAPFIALGHAVEKTWDTAVLSLKMLGSMVFGQRVVEKFERAHHYCRLCRTIRAHRLEGISWFSGTDQYQPRRA